MVKINYINFFGVDFLLLLLLIVIKNIQKWVPKQKLCDERDFLISSD
jgi:hypothetical protein